MLRRRNDNSAVTLPHVKKIAGQRQRAALLISKRPGKQQSIQQQDAATLPVAPKLQPGEIRPHKERCIINYKTIGRQLADNHRAVLQVGKKACLRQHLRRQPGSKLQQIIAAGRQQCAHKCQLRGNFQHRHQHDIAYQCNQRKLVKIVNLQRQHSQLCCH